MNSILASWTSTAPSILAAFMASLVEFVEALTIVLAVGVVRGWRSALMGTGAAMAVLFALVAALGPALARIPLQVVQLGVGTLLLLFGLRWLRKAILRAAGVLPMHDETKAFEKQLVSMQGHAVASGPGIDAVAFGSAFKIVMLEGIEVVFIVIGIGAGGTLLAPACLGAALALLVVIALGLWLHRPLARVPENTLKFAVGVIVTAFACFWVGEGIGLDWPGADRSLIALVAGFLVLAIALVAVSRSWAVRRAGRSKAVTGSVASTSRGALGVVFDELVGLVVDDGWLAIAALAWIALAWIAVGQALGDRPVASAVLFSAGLALALAASVLRKARG